MISQKKTSYSKSIVARGGITFFWVLNDHCDRASLTAQLHDFRNAGVEAVVLHPRGGLLVPYGSVDWFDLIRWLSVQCRRHGIEPILYDEDPYPSGNAGGRLIADFPELAGSVIERVIPETPLAEGELFIFPTGRLCWAGIVFPDNPRRSPIDLTSKVGMIRRHWEKAEWDSQWYYPATPVYSCPRSFALHAEFALICPPIPPEGKLVAFVAKKIKNGGEWGGLVDTLNHEATRRFLQSTHEKYARHLKGMLGSSIQAIFTDEAKPHATHPWTSGMFESFLEKYGYDLRPCLDHLFSPEEFSSPQKSTVLSIQESNRNVISGMRVRLDYREWIISRFEEAWIRPVAAWSKRNGLSLIGHFSPEEDPVNQSATIGNVFPLQKSLAIPGYDLIIPAVGDKKHPLLNIASVLAISAAQQNRQVGVCCESLGAFGSTVAPHIVARVLAWQVLHGTSLAVLHGVFSSTVGLRRYEAPPDYGPKSDLWEPIMQMRRILEPFLSSTLGASQEAPVAILWPIMSFQAMGATWQSENSGLRKDLVDLLSTCLRNQIGVHFIDEQALSSGKLENNHFRVGKASYQWIIVPSATVVGDDAYQKLSLLLRGGIKVVGVGSPIQWVRPHKAPLRRIKKCAWTQFSPTEFQSLCVDLLPRLVEIQGKKRTEFHTTIWSNKRGREMLVMNLGSTRSRIALGGCEISFSAGELVRFTEKDGGWQIDARFAPHNFREAEKIEVAVKFGKWKINFPGGGIKYSTNPLAAYQLVSGHPSEFVYTILTRRMNLAGKQVAKAIVYRVVATFPRDLRRAVLVVEPTLMRGKFTLKIGINKWDFSVKDTDTSCRRIDISDAVKHGRVPLTFILHSPEAPDGIKNKPQIEIEM